MKPIHLAEIRRVVSGHLLAAPRPDEPVIHAVGTDTRQLAPSSLFVAIRGENHDGHAFLAQAAADGAVAALVQADPSDKPPRLYIVRVDNTRAALGDLARHVRRQWPGKVIAVGGSNGKTGTKHLIHSALSVALGGTISPKSFNNDIGVPLAIFPAEDRHDYLVLELGTNHHGEIRNLTGIALPDIAVITCTAIEHLEGLDDLDGVRREEAALIDGLRPDGLLIVNGDDPAFLQLVCRHPGRRITFGFHPANDLFPTDIRCDLHGTSFKLNGELDLFVPMLGRHIASNALAAVAVARAMGLTDTQIQQGLAHAQPPDMRLAVQSAGHITLLNDAYNANPASMTAALETLCMLQPRGRRVAVLGDMRELGQHADDCHRDLGAVAGGLPLGLLFCVGEKAALIAEQARASGRLAPDQIVAWPDTPAAAAAIPTRLHDGDLVLLKASRTMRFESIARAIAAEAQRKAES